MSNIPTSKMNTKPKSQIASKIPTSGRDSGTHSRSSSVSNLTSASDIHSEIGDATSDSVEDFKVDDRVWVNGTKPGYVKFIGKTQFAPGVWAGILLDDPVGKNDGSVSGVKYFTCEPLRGIFARPAKLTKTASDISVVGDSSMVGAVTPKSGNIIPSSRASVCSNMSSSSPKYPKLKVGDRITVSSLSGLKAGTLKFVGETDFAKGEWAGIELDEPTGKNDGSVAGKRYFSCQMKYGLFAPLHKVSRPGMTTPVSRPGSVRGTPLMRSNSRDSLSSSISTCSRSSRVKLGVTSLTSAQKSRQSGSGITTTSKALQDALKEKELHIEQLLKERDLDRAEFARLTTHFEEIDKKSYDLEKKQKSTESDKKSLEEQLNTVQRKLEDIQFQLEEEKILKADIEAQLQQRSLVLKRIEEFIVKESGNKFINIKEILSGQETLSEICEVTTASGDSIDFQKKIDELESNIKLLSQEKQELNNQLTILQKSSSENIAKNESQITSLNTVVQEKDDMIANLKNELNSNIEKVMQLIEDNKNLSDQMLLKEVQAKGHADDVIKELGEKIKSLSDELKTKSSQLAEYVTSVQDKDNKIATLEGSLNDQSTVLLNLQNEYKNISDALKQKECECEEKVSAQKSLEESIVCLKSQLETLDETNQKKINLLEEEIKTKSSLLSDYLSSIEEKENLISSLQQNFDSQAAALSQLQSEKRELNDSLKQKDLELGDKVSKIKSLEENITALTAQNESTVSETQKKMLDLVKEIERLTNSVQEKEDQLLKAQNELIASHSTIEKLNETVQELSEKAQQSDLNLTAASKDATEKIMSLQNELSSVIQEKSDLRSEYEKDIEDFKTVLKTREDELLNKKDVIAEHESQITVLTGKLKNTEDEHSALKKEISSLIEKKKEISEEKGILESAIKEKEELIVDFTKQVDSFKKCIEKNNADLELNAKLLQSLQDSLNLKEEENNQLASKLQVAEQKVEMLNKDSSDHVMTLQNELSKIKEASTTTKTHLEQELSKIRNEKEKLLDSIREKDALLVEKEETFISLEKKVNEKESEISDLLSQKTDLLQTITKCNSTFEEAKTNHEEKLSSIISEYELKLSERDQELLAEKNEKEKISCNITEKEKCLLEKEESILILQNKLKEKESEVSDLSSQNDDLLKNITKFSCEIEEGQKMYNEKLSSSTAEFDNKLKEKDDIIQNMQNELKKCMQHLEDNAKELSTKEKEINVLKSSVNDKESQFQELTKMVESSLCQVSVLKEQNEKNESLLQSKESFINDFKTDQETQLLLKEQSFKEETSKLQYTLQSKEEEITRKQIEISNLLNEVADKNKLVENLQKEIETAKADKERLSNDSSNIYQELNNRISEMEGKYSKLLEEKEKITNEELQTRNAKKNLEEVRDSLIQEKSAQEQIVKDKEAKLEALQAEVKRMQAEFSQHKEELQQKLDVSEMELQATLELKNQMDVQHGVIEELQLELQNSDETCKKLENEVQVIAVITAEKDKLQAQIDEFQKTNKERSDMITKMETKYQSLEEQLENNKNLILQKEKEVSDLKEQLKKMHTNKNTPESINSSLKSLEEENLALKNKITLLELEKVEKKPDTSSKTSTKELSPEEAEEKESLLSQIDFLNSIIVDMKQKNEELTRQLEAQTSCWEENDVNLNETKKVIAPRLFCDICDCFDLHETCDCPKQESFADDEEVPQLRRAGTRQMEERPYCNNCEMFGHWTLDCEEPDTF